ncbi:MAG TPA: ADP-ribosylglycohydrolase family protein [Pseudonocardia sp.]|nr:ADP-ribosylglycohydrolase family protein [Pseudonocardia sp.]
MTRDRARGALHGLAVGDALGMPTESTPRAEIVERYGVLVDRFYPGPPGHALAAELPAGSVTDDTEQAVLLGWLMVESEGRVDPRELGRRLVAWEETMRERGSAGLLGPSTKRALAALAAGAEPAEAGRSGTTNGAAMRIAPVGIAVPVGDGLIDRVVEASLVTHGTGVALAGAAAVAAAVSAGIDGATVRETFDVAADAAERAAERGRWVAAADVAARIRWATKLVRRGREPVETIGTLVGTGLATQESVPAAFAVLALAGDDPWLACKLGASVGGDCDTIAAMAGAVAGACCGVDALPVRANVEHLDLDGLADALLALRTGS